jgi:ribonuclease HI
MSNALKTHYQSLLLNPPRVHFFPSTTLNAATLLTNPDLEAPLHDCAGILSQAHGLRKDLTDQPLSDAEITWFTDGSSFIRDGQRYAGAAVVTESEVIWAAALTAGTSAQRAELIALTKALELGKDKKLNVYTDSRYAFAMAHVHGAIYQKRGLLTAEGKTIKNKQEILDLLAALWLPKKYAIIHCPGHQKAETPIARGN